jgi:hypothetical protein
MHVANKCDHDRAECLAGKLTPNLPVMPERINYTPQSPPKHGNFSPESLGGDLCRSCRIRRLARYSEPTATARSSMGMKLALPALNAFSAPDETIFTGSCHRRVPAHQSLFRITINAARMAEC